MCTCKFLLSFFHFVISISALPKACAPDPNTCTCYSQIPNREKQSQNGVEVETCCSFIQKQRYTIHLWLLFLFCLFIYLFFFVCLFYGLLRISLWNFSDHKVQSLMFLFSFSKITVFIVKSSSRVYTIAYLSRFGQRLSLNAFSQ